MSFFETLVDGTNFGLVADYLKIRNSPIEALLHVKDRAKLSKLAEELEKELREGVKPGRFPKAIERMLDDGSLKLSLRDDFSCSNARILIDPSRVPSVARCQVIYFPPFYLVHTPGLLDGKMFDAPELSEKKMKEARVGIQSA